MYTHMSANSQSATIERRQRSNALSPDHPLHCLSTTHTPSFGKISSSQGSIREKGDLNIEEISRIMRRSRQQGYTSRDDAETLRLKGVSESQINGITQGIPRLKGGLGVVSTLAIGGAIIAICRLCYKASRQRPASHFGSKEEAAQALDHYTKLLADMRKIEKDLVWNTSRSLPYEEFMRMSKKFDSVMNLIIELKEFYEVVLKREDKYLDPDWLKESTDKLSKEMDALQIEAELIRKHYPEENSCHIM